VIYYEHELIPIEQIKTELLSLCAGKRSGDFCLFTEEKHAAVISIHEGDIVGLRYRISRGNDALMLIKRINKAKIRFEVNNTGSDYVDSTTIPSTVEIFEILGIGLGDDAYQEIGKEILVVEDSRTQRNIICKMLTQYGYRTLQAADGYDALEQLNKVKPDLILLDIVMPGIDGYKVLSAIKEKPGMKNIPVIMLTSRDTLFDKMRGKVSDSDEYLTKPFRSEELIEKVNKYLHCNNCLLDVRAKL